MSGFVGGGGVSSELRSVVLAHVLVDELVRGGVEHVVVSPGSRNAPLAMAVLAAENAGRLRLHVRIDERSAAFTALGLAKATGQVVAVMTTSGTAVANLHPAVLEAHHSGVRLLVVSADRPAGLRGTGANQTTDQARLFGEAAAFVEVASSEGAVFPCAGWRSAVCRALAFAAAGPTQLNVALTPPLVRTISPTDVDDPAFVGRPVGAPWTRITELPSPAPPVLANAPLRTVVVVGDATPEVGGAAIALAEQAGWPLFAEPSSNARAGVNAIRLYRLLLGASQGAAAELTKTIERVIVVGHPTLSRPVSRLLARTDVEIVVCGGTPWVDVAGVARTVLSAVPTIDRGAEIDQAWLAEWQRLDADLASRLPSSTELDGRAIADAVAAAANSSADALVVGSSNPVRDLDLAVPASELGAPVYANRGLAGIDGVVSTAVGIALAGKKTLALMGDLTFLHDANALLIGPSESRPDLRIVVVNDDGGSIFHTLEQGAPEHADSFERLFGTPHGTDLEARSKALGVRHRRVGTASELTSALAEPIDGIDVVEAQISRRSRRDDAEAMARLAEWPAPEAKSSKLQ